MKKEKVKQIMDKVIAEWQKKVPKGATIDQKQIEDLKNTLLQSTHEDGCQRISVMTSKGCTTHLVPFEDLILKGVTGKQALKYPVEKNE